MNIKILAAVAMLTLSLGVQAQTVPALDRTALVEAIPADFGEVVKLDAKEREALSLAKEWINNPTKPVRAADGSVKYVYGATIPALICAKLRVCMIRLEEGEELVDDIMAADPVRWKTIPMMVGAEGRQTTMIAVKALSAGLVTNIVINTNRRAYMILLKSTDKDWIPEMSFFYPENVEKAWASYKSKKKQIAYSSTLSTGESMDNLDFNYQMTGESKWKPIRVYNNGKQTYVQFASAEFNNGAPALVAVGKSAGWFSDESTEIYNYSPIGDRYVVDGVPERMMLISGVGKDEKKVVIDYVGGKPR